MPSDDILKLFAKYKPQVRESPANNVYDFALRHRRIERRPFNLERYRPLQALYEDDWPLIDVMKPAQRGVSEWAISLVCFALDQGARRWVPDGSKSGLNVGYVFPARSDLIEFSKERLSGLKEESTYLADMFGTDDDRFDSLAFKQVGDSFLYLRGGYSTTGLRSFPCDVLILDEYDELDMGAVALARRRLNASLVKRLVRISTPTIPGAGISKAYAESDQRVYETACEFCAVECSHCSRPMAAPRGTLCGARGCMGVASTWTTYDFFRDVWADDHPWDEWQKWNAQHLLHADLELRCPNCHQPQSSKARCAPGRWVSLAPENSRTHGYHIPWWPWPEPMMELLQLVLEAITDDPSESEQFFRSDLGIPHGASGGRIDPEMLLQLAAELPDGLPDGPWSDTVMGADIGARIHYRIDSIGPGGFVYVREVGSVPDFSGLDTLMQKFNVRRAVVDAEPEWHGSMEFCQRWPGRALRCFYPGNANAVKTDLFNLKEGTFDIQANRTQIIDLVYATIASCGERWPKNIATNEELISHMGNITRVRVTDEGTGRSYYNWVRTGPDHHIHTCFEAGTNVATEVGDVPIEDIQPGMKVWTRNGLRCVKASGCTSQLAEVVEYEFSNGRSFWATPDHLLWTTNRGWVPLHAVNYTDILEQWVREPLGLKSSSIEESRFGAIRPQRTGLIASTSRLADETVRTASSVCTRRFGKISTGLSRLATTFTTKTMIRSTMSRRTSFVSQSRITAGITSLNIMPITWMRLGLTWTGFVRYRTPGGVPQKATTGTARTRRMCSARWQNSLASAAVRPSLGKLADACWKTLVRFVHGSVGGLKFRPTVIVVVWTTLIASALFVGSRFGAIGTGKPKRARSAAVVRLRRRGATRKCVPVYNLSVEGDEEFFASGVLVHNCAYSLLARKTLPPPAPAFQPAVSGDRPVVDNYQRVANMNTGRLGAMPRDVPSWFPPAVR